MADNKTAAFRIEYGLLVSPLNRPPGAQGVLTLTKQKNLASSHIRS